MAKFTLNINMGNEAMQTPADVAEALHNAATRIMQIHGRVGHGAIRDRNGNTVGSFTLDEAPEKLYDVRLMSDGDEVESLKGKTPAEIVEHFGLGDTGAIAQLCKWADDTNDPQGHAVGLADSLVIEAHE